MSGVRLGRGRGACGAWTGCVHWFGQICTFKKERPGEMGARGANVPEPVHLTRVPQCALPGHRHQPRTGRQLQTVRPGTCATPDSAAPALPVRTACPPHPALPVRTACPPHPAPPVRTACPPHPVLPDHPQTLTPPANSETPRPPNGRRGVNTQRGVSARRLTRQLRKSPRPQRRHLRCRLLARPLRERQRPQEQQR